MRRRKTAKRNNIWKCIVIIAAACFIWAAVSRWQERNMHVIQQPEQWNLIVVNKWNKVPDDYMVMLTELKNGEKVDERIYPHLQAMFDAARADGIYPVVREGYRTREEQQKILDEKIQAYRSEGYGELLAESSAKAYVALPGTSEHELGIAVDINADKSRCTNDEVYAWLALHAYEYGFILRYPLGKDRITGTTYEPWHFRYVGDEAAQKIHETGLTLEEYVK